jgi:hypothetical protein
MPRYYEFEVTLQDMEPRIWRRFLLRTTSTFAHLHQAIQSAFGWRDCHLHEFRLPGPTRRVLAGSPLNGGHDYGRPTPDGRKVKLNSYFVGTWAREWCEYEYDFGDSWVHEVKLIGIHSDKATFKRRLLGGARACPPEDAGGPPGYERCVQFVTTGEDVWDDAGVLGEWLGDWKPGLFDLDAACARFDQ